MKKLVWCLSVFLFHSGVVFAGSPFYLTVERSFAPDEEPILRLDYTTSEAPLQLKILQPKNLEAFLEGQLQVSRSYEEPQAALNPGHYLLRGVNKVRSPFESIRRFINPDVRDRLGGAFDNPVKVAAESRLTSIPAELSVTQPKGMQLIREFWIDLQRGGEKPKDSVPGFESIWWPSQGYYGYGGYEQREIKLAKLPQGVYLLQGVQGSYEAQALLQVTSMGVQVKQSSAQLLVRVLDRSSNPVAGAEVQMRDGRGTWHALPSKTNNSGELLFEDATGNLDRRLILKVSKGDLIALADTDFLPAKRVDTSLFLLTDRPIFKPGDEVHYKGLIRTFTNGKLRLPQDTTQRPPILGPIELKVDQEVAAKDHSPNGMTPFASFSGKFAIDKDAKPGLYRVAVQAGSESHIGELRVRDYVKPTFYLELKETKGSLRPGKTFEAVVQATRYAGGVPTGARYEVFAYRKKYDAPQWVEESGGGLETGPDYFSGIQSTNPLSQPQRIYSSVEERQDAYSANEEGIFEGSWTTAPTFDRDGIAKIRFSLPDIATGHDEEWIYTFMVRALDPQGSSATLSKNYYATLAGIVASGGFERQIIATGEAAHFNAKLSTPDGEDAGGAGRIEWKEEALDGSTRIVNATAFTTDERGFAKIKAPTLANGGRLFARVVVEKEGTTALKVRPSSQWYSLIVAAEGGAASVASKRLELYPVKTVLSPGETTRVLALLPEGWGSTGNSGTIWESYAGQTILSSQGRNQRGRTIWFEVTAKPDFGTGFYYTVTIPLSGGKFQEQSLGFRILPQDKKLAIKIDLPKEAAEPMRPYKLAFELKTADGRAAAETELSISVVDRAVYAVQPEFRPNILEFFYPLTRLNLMTFYADELQGYGYADAIRTPNFELGALKSQNQLEKQFERDTAGFFPHIVTNGDGRAEVTVDLPANETEWLVTVVAADKEGRLGEQTTKFRSSRASGASLRLAQFMRKGDELDLPFLFSNRSADQTTIEANVKVKAPLSTNSDTKFSEILQANQEKTNFIRVNALQDVGKVEIEVESGINATRNRLLALATTLKPASLEQSYWTVQATDSDKLFTALPAAGSVRKVRVEAAYGLIGAALHAASYLASYPYGCTEQLTHSTVPNLVLLDVLNKSGVDAKTLGRHGELFRLAKENSASGLSRLVANQRANGAFGMWSGDKEESFTVTLIAMTGLLKALELGHGELRPAYEKAQAWIASKADQPVNLALLNPEITFQIGQLALLAKEFAPEAGRFVNHVANASQSTPNRMNELTTALNVIAQLGERASIMAQTNQLISELKREIERFDETNFINYARNNPAASGFSFGIPRTLAAAMGTLHHHGALDEGLQKRLVSQLLSHMQGGKWQSTFDTAEVLYHTRSILSDEAQALARLKQSSQTYAVTTADNQTIGKLSASFAGFSGEFAGGVRGIADFTTLNIAHLPENTRAMALFTVDVPNDFVRAESKGILVSRSLYRLTGKGRMTAVNSTTELKTGDVVVSAVRIERSAAPESTLPSEFLVIEDPIPSIAEAIDSDQEYLAEAGFEKVTEASWRQTKETLRYPERTVRVVKLPVRGNAFTAYGVWRVAYSGKAALNSATAHDMYDERIQGNSEAMVLSSK